MLPVNEIFETMQGEAAFTGSPAVFVRLQGCPVGCPWCDTKHTWIVDHGRQVSLETVEAKTEDADTFALAGPEALALRLVRATQARHVVITGGEPALYDLRAFSAALLQQGRTVQLETSGTQDIRISPDAWVTVSPKIGMPGGLKVRADAVWRANEIKMPVGKPADVEKLKAFLAEHPGHTSLVWLQPLSQSPKATALCVQAATENGWRVSVQTHKFLGVR